MTEWAIEDLRRRQSNELCRSDSTELCSAQMRNRKRRFSTTTRSSTSLIGSIVDGTPSSGPLPSLVFAEFDVRCRITCSSDRKSDLSDQSLNKMKQLFVQPLIESIAVCARTLGCQPVHSPRRLEAHGCKILTELSRITLITVYCVVLRKL